MNQTSFIPNYSDKCYDEKLKLHAMYLKFMIERFFDNEQNFKNLKNSVKTLNEIITKKMETLSAQAYMYGRTKIMDDSSINAWLTNTYYAGIPYVKAKSVYYERHNTHVMKWLIEHKHKLVQWFNVDIPSINKLLKYNAICINGWARIIYYKSTKHAQTVDSLKEFGRRYSYRGISLQSLCRTFRNLLTYGIYFEADISNCHPTLLSFLLEKEKLSCENIIEFRNNREKYLSELMKLNNISRDMAKETFLSIMLADEHGSSLYNQLKNKTPFIQDLKKEFILAMNIIVSKNKTLFEELESTLNEKYERDLKFWTKNKCYAAKPKRKSTKSSVTSYYLHSLEDAILSLTEDFYKKQNIIDNEISLIFDGVLIDVSKKQLWMNSLNELQCIIKRETGVNIYLKAKDMQLDMSLSGMKQAKLQSLLKQTEPTKSLSSVLKLFDLEYRKHKNTAIQYNELPDDQIHADLTLSCAQLPSILTWIKKNKTLMIKSSMGSSKTKRTYEYFKKMPKSERILIISFRRSLNRKYYQDLHKLGFEIYDNCKGPIWDSKQYPRLIVQINSLWKVTGEYDVTLLDEISYTLDILIDYSDHKYQNVRALESYIKNSMKLIVLDAFLTNSNINYVKCIRGSYGCLVIDNKKKKHEGDLELMKYDPFLTKIKDKLESKKRIVIISNSRAFLQKKIKPILENMKLKYLIVDQDTDELTDLDDWVNYDVVAYTPTIVAGLSFEIQDVFDSRFCYFADTSAPADICAQMCFRVRHTSENKIYVCIQKHLFNENFPIEKESIDKWLESYITLDFSESDKKRYINQAMVDAQLLSYDNYSRQYQKDHYYEILTDYFRKRFLSKCYFGNRFVYYLGIQGWKQKVHDIKLTELNHIDDVCEILNELSKKQYKLDKEIISNEYKIRAKNILDKQSFMELMKYKRKSKEDRMDLNIYILHTLFNVDFEKSTVNEINLMVKHFDSLLFETKFKQSKFDDPIKFALSQYSKSNAGMQEQWHSQWFRDFYMKSFRLLELISIIGFNSFYDYDSEIVMDAKVFKKVGDYTYKHRKDFIHLFNYNNKKYTSKSHYYHPNLRQFIQKINPLLKKIGRKINWNRQKPINENDAKKYKLHPIVPKQATHTESQ